MCRQFESFDMKNLKSIFGKTNSALLYEGHQLNRGHLLHHAAGNVNHACFDMTFTEITCRMFW